MIIGMKDAKKLAGISIVACCAVFICTLFLNYNMDIENIKDQITAGPMQVFYDAQISSSKVISIVSGGCLLITSVIMLLFYIKHYIDEHKKELGILKALGYSDMKIAKAFWIFGVGIFFGTAVGFGGSFVLMPTFYDVMNEEALLPEYSVHFHPSLALCMVVLPTIFFSLLAIFYARHKVGGPVIGLLRSTGKQKEQKNPVKGDHSGKPFLWELRHSIVKNHKSLSFFVGFATFCYSAMTQMSFSMKELASVMFSIMVITIGVILACTTLFLAISTVVRSNTKTIAMMRTMGYSLRHCSKAVLGGYRPIAYTGVVIGTIYQYALLKIMVSVIFKDVSNMPEYHFDVPVMVLCMISFVLIYEAAMYYYSVRISKVPIKEIMSEA